MGGRGDEITGRSWLEEVRQVGGVVRCCAKTGPANQLG